MFVSKFKYNQLNVMYNEMVENFFTAKNEAKRNEEFFKLKIMDLEKERDNYKKMYYDEMQKRFELIEILKKINGDKNV